MKDSGEYRCREIELVQTLNSKLCNSSDCKRVPWEELRPGQGDATTNCFCNLWTLSFLCRSPSHCNVLLLFRLIQRKPQWNWPSRHFWRWVAGQWPWNSSEFSFGFIFWLLQVVQSGGKNLEICVMSEGQKMRMMALPEIEKVVAEVEKEKEEEAAQKKKEKQSEKKWGGFPREFPKRRIFKDTKTSTGWQMYFNLCLFAKRIGQVKKTWERE